MRQGADAVHPRALIVDLSTRFGGSNARVLGLLAAMPRGSAAIAVVDDAAVRSAADDLGVPVHPVARHKADPRIPIRLARLIRERRYAVVDTQNPQSRLWGSLAARATGVALVSTLNSWYEAEHEGRLKGRVYQALERWSPRPDAWIAVAPDIRDRLLSWADGPETVALIPNAIDVALEAPSHDPRTIRASLGFPDDAHLAVAVGRLVEAKGYGTLVDAIGLLAASLPSVHAVILGEGHLRASLERRVHDLGLERRVSLPGFRPPREVLAIVRSADVFVMPSRTEGTPLALLEAAALERPIVASRVGGIPGLVEHDREALLVAPGDPRVLADAIGGLVADPPRARELGRAAGRRVARDFDRARQADDTLAVYRRAVDRRRALRVSRPH